MYFITVMLHWYHDNFNVLLEDSVGTKDSSPVNGEINLDAAVGLVLIENSTKSSMNMYYNYVSNA